ncbi:Dephospho-CoA kinase [Candidatus Xiphinematobacter sp. Idaho Grape]|uniref:dephospho-CoA kinase n=1 Tax=Candidatus Xiphinematobacter sp. Idaho Grape TaxID=1704307 RepID=UPI00070613B5|nr:dephospho-CoA kinase [Candidatus Xiphinematobacter sp. Idaho Grape]ALJ56387.1 Dephospho-CoA kinase [Candidatus Xiphinematobacter sp. Idaho Grape]
MRTVPTVAITGGIASGKTSFCRHLSVFLENTEWFDADACVSRLLDGSEEVRVETAKVLGKGVYVGGKLDRAQVRSRIFSDPRRRVQLERVLHPRVRKIWMAQAVRSKAVGRKFVADVPLLYEAGWETACDFIAVIACSSAKQLQRLTSRGVCESLARKMIAVQLPMEEKMRRAHEVVWNNGPLQLLTEQARITADYLNEHYG